MQQVRGKCLRAEITQISAQMRRSGRHTLRRCMVCRVNSFFPGSMQQITARLCDLHAKANEFEPAWREYEDFMKLSGAPLPAATWPDLCRTMEEQQNFGRALIQYENLASAYPKERQSLMALMGAARLCAKRLGRPQDAIRFYEAVSVSPIPHLDLEQLSKRAFGKRRRWSPARLRRR